MKLTSILLLFCALHVSAAGYSQQISISKNETNLEEVFGEIKKQSGYLVFYSGQVNPAAHQLDVQFNNLPLREALDKCLQNQGLSYTIVNKTIVVKTNGQPARRLSAPAQMQLKGTVVDAQTQEPMIAVSIYLKNNRNRATQSDANGNFSITASTGEILVFSFIGYETQEITVDKDETLSIFLNPTVHQIQDVVITGYQQINRETYTGNVVTIQGEELKRMNPQSILESVQSFDPSFKMLDNNLLGSDPNSMPRINVRGATALPSISDTDNLLDRNNLSSNYNLPAFILDGFEVSLQKVTDLDINRIESVTLLKDAAATAVYGSRAANGVMVITTKAPIAGKLQLGYNYEFIFTGPDISDYNILNAEEKLAYEELAGLYLTGNSTANTQEQLDADYFLRRKNVVSGVNTHWISQPLQNAYGHRHTLFVQGGDETFRYGVDLRYHNAPGVMIGSGRTRYSGGMNFTYNPNRRLLFKNEVTVTQVQGKNSPYGDFSTYVRMNPYFPKTDSAGNLIQEVASWRIDTRASGEDQYKTINVFNPLFESSLSSFDESSYLEILDAFSADYRISDDFRLRGLVSLNKTTEQSDRFISPLSSEYFNYESSELNNRGYYRYGGANRLTIDGNVTLGYNKQINDHFFNLVLGANVLSSRFDFKSFEAQGFSNDRFTNIGFARTYRENTAPGGDVSLTRTAGTFFSGNYALKNRYLLDASFRYEGSSTFGANQRFAPFWALGLGWNIHHEEFLRDSELISQLRLKSSTGILGSVGFPAYLSRSIYQYHTANWYSTGLGATVMGFGNENLRWQKTQTYDVGLDIGFLQDRIVLTPRYYHKLTEGLITDINLAPSTGFTTYKENLGDMANEGFELYLQANLKRTENLNVNITGNLARNRNKLVKISNSLKAFNEKIDEMQTDPENNALAVPLLRYNEGQSINTIYAVRSLGIDPENGKEIFIKKDGSRTYTWDVKDTQPVGDTSPDAEGNLGGNISYKNFMISFNFYYRFGGDLYNQTLVDRVENADPRFNVDRRVLEERWKNPGDQALYKNIADLGSTHASSRFIQKDNLIELQSVYLSYDFNKAFIRKAGLQNLRTSVTMNDLFRSSSIEIERGINYPFARTVTFSLQASF